jgi:hypothetical protein
VGLRWAMAWAGLWATVVDTWRLRRPRMEAMVLPPPVLTMELLYRRQLR